MRGKGPSKGSECALLLRLCPDAFRGAAHKAATRGDCVAAGSESLSENCEQGESQVVLGSNASLPCIIKRGVAEAAQRGALGSVGEMLRNGALMDKASVLDSAAEPKFKSKTGAIGVLQETVSWSLPSAAQFPGLIRKEVDAVLVSARAISEASR